MLWLLICTMHMMVCYRHVMYTFQSEFTLNSCLNVKELFAQNSHNTWSLSHSNRIWIQNHLVCKQTLNHLANLPNDWALSWVLICMVHLTECYYHATYAFQSESTLYSCLNFKELSTRNWCSSWSFSGSNRIRTHNDLVHKRTLNHLAKFAKFVKFVKFVSYVVSTYGAFDCMLLSCLSMHFRVNLHCIVAWMSRNSIFKKVWYSKIKWRQGDSINISQVTRKRNR